MQSPGLLSAYELQQGAGAPFVSINPATGKEVWAGKAATAEQVDLAVRSARAAFPSWSSLPLEDRIQIFKQFEELLKAKENSVAEAISMETGKPLWDAKNEVASVKAKLAISLEAYESRCQEIIKDVPNGLSITRHRPHGVLGILGPFNFPTHLPQGHIVPALLSGNTIVFKPSEYTPAVGQLLYDLWMAAGLPKGVFNVVQGGRATGEALVLHRDINGLLFTGSSQAGKNISKMYGEHPEKILALEMGGNNPLVITQVEDIQAAAYITIQSAFLTAGQRCTCARRLILPTGPQGDKILEAITKMTQAISIGPYTDKPEPFMGPVISAQQAEKIIASQRQLIEAGAVPLIPCEHKLKGTGFVTAGLLEATRVKPLPDEEIFGPLLKVIRVKNFQEAIEEANRTAYGLTAGLISENKTEYDQFLREVRAGLINWNTPTTGASSTAPFGGVGISGNHRPSALYAVDYCSYPVASIENREIKMPKTALPGIKLEEEK